MVNESTHAEVQSSEGNGREYYVRIFAATQTIWVSTRLLAASGRRYTLAVDVPWFEQDVSLAFDEAVHATKPGRFPAYDAMLEVYGSALQVDRPFEVQLDGLGAVVVLTVVADALCCHCDNAACITSWVGKPRCRTADAQCETLLHAHVQIARQHSQAMQFAMGHYA